MLLHELMRIDVSQLVVSLAASASSQQQPAS